MKLLLIANTIFALANFRAGLVGRLVGKGHEVIAAGPDDDYAVYLRQLGVRVINLPMRATSLSPMSETVLLARIYRLLRAERPDAILGYTIKPNLYGALSARALGIPFVPNVTGLGMAFDSKGWLSFTAKMLYRAAFRSSPRVFFQNPNDQDFFVKSGLVRLEQSQLLPGSGVDLGRFTPVPSRASNQPVFLLVSRMLREKGVGEYVEAAQRVKDRYPDAVFQLLGSIDPANPSAIGEEAIRAWVEAGYVNYLGSTKDVRPILREADCVVLPSYYREGTPRTLLEAAATAKPIITTDMPGCRDTIIPGESGLLCKPRDSDDLAARMIEMIELSAEQRATMGKAGRALMEQRFDERLVIDAYLAVLDEIESRSERR